MAKVIYNARIHTCHPAQATANALAIEGEQVVAVGSNEDILRTYNRTGAIDAGGQAIIPGLTDAHFHLETYALNLHRVNCETQTRDECLERVAARARKTPPGEWIFGHGWNQNNWPEGFGNPLDLDKVSPYNPVYLTAKSLHAAWVNSPAMHMAGIGLHTQDPVGGHLHRLLDGTPDGILSESAMQLVADNVPEPTLDQVEKAILEAQTSLIKMGVTGLHDFDRRRCFSALQNLHNQNLLRVRVTKSLPLEDLPHAYQLGLKTGFGDSFLRIGSIKGFADGALGPHTAAMFSPYEDAPQNHGILMLDAEELFEQGKAAVACGLSLAIHAIGDRAVHEVLNAYNHLRDYEKAIHPDSSQRLRHRIEHVQVIHPNDQGRLADLTVIASMQPIHATSDMEMADRFWGKRASLAYAWRTQLQHGAILAFGSDAPVESPNPFWGLHAAVTRRREDGSPHPGGWYPEQRLSLPEALQGFTTGPAYATGMENRLGCLAPGYLADLLILDTDIFTCDPMQIKDTRPTATMIGGAWVWQSG